MKVILLRDVAKLGRQNQVVEVPNGRGLNQLIPQGWALQATPFNLKKAASLNAQKDATVAAVGQQFTAARNALKDKVVELSVKANEQGHLFQAIKPEDVTKALSIMGVDVPVDMINFTNPIKEVGEQSFLLKSKEGEVEVALLVKSE